MYNISYIYITDLRIWQKLEFLSYITYASEVRMAEAALKCSPALEGDEHLQRCRWVLVGMIPHGSMLLAMGPWDVP